ncbi:MULTISPECIES: acetolactate synthase small subunit [Roseivirga]|jgi:acetolactate synthase-1/3 small subunit|uniref:acetolactate synthase small subunit n=1 Tax=Roseivirga TaxID=290180 RepID=UPI0025795BC9|nr:MULTISPECIES: acetolactate synthase small subunit [Roseivirga]MEC7755817.1 acetolactate synthase small subunit [Bacteroidota bacterium]|tara:strand:- start:6704 stop:7258 length:555 start_codon:yes stop_codon:yes gene_type:complete
MRKDFTITVFTENHIGLLNRITSVFTRRHLNIESLNTSESQIPGIHRFTIVLNTTEEIVQKIVLQLEKQVEVIKAVYHLDEETVFQEITLFKVSVEQAAQHNLVERLIRDKNARILSVEQDFMIIEKTGHKAENDDLLEFLRPFGLIDYVKSGRVSLIKPDEELKNLHELVNEARQANNNQSFN